MRDTRLLRGSDDGSMLGEALPGLAPGDQQQLLGTGERGIQGLGFRVVERYDRPDGSGRNPLTIAAPTRYPEKF